ncbi:FecR domain-containing protein [Pseudomonas sp. LP_7_YM]|uniref:FecR domain-containing protein n=1 Tax=Pseudomonas sp. LP_7_YM TaxID=2485137 RepID=UPI00105E9BDA|nr:FecR family protein [Pseudomonas sp. LP_7_YM]TDV70286.1 FecR family protein [Pseudomonas sp. LP_7_YM]
MNSVAEPARETVMAATEWMAQLHSGEMDAAQRLALQAWQAADPSHGLAWSRLEMLWGRFDALPPKPAINALEKALAPVRRNPLRPALGALVLALLAWQGVARGPLWFADQRTGFAQRLDIELDDHSRLQLNSDSAVDVHFNARQRLIDLKRGELWVEVAKDPQRPFIVRTEHGTVTALGTRFLVKREDGHTQVTVLESAISARPSEVVDLNARVAAGQQATLFTDHVEGPNAQGKGDPAAWTRGLLKVEDRPLVEVLDELSRYRKGVMHFDRQALQGLRVSGVFPLDDSDKALQALQANLPIKLQRFTDWVLWIRPTG